MVGNAVTGLSELAISVPRVEVRARQDNLRRLPPRVGAYLFDAEAVQDATGQTPSKSTVIEECVT